ncbi:MAG: TonB-dependent receptor [Candidatus Symbiothrix sp.]|jgi:TonB-linked SusC/RagA family outer membrane protein|nr:TonB-dependent receptor [Candidatus Symbiothrix sp.]
MNSKREFKWRVFAEKTNNLMRVCALLLVCSLSMTAFAQTSIKVTGTVTDPSGETLIGASVAEKGTTNGTVTDLDGNFSLTTSPGATLTITYIGYFTATVPVAVNKTHYDITLNEDRQSLDEVVVVGYGVQKKKLVTGATVQVSGDNLQKLSTTTALGALQSQSPGVNITQQSGEPGAGFNVIIRGMGTMDNFAPLYVIDGIPGGDINNLNPSDIESVDVLKDAASAAIYGARGANGIIMVTTRQGKAGKTQVTYDGFYGVQNVYKMPDLLDAKQYMAIQDETRFNEGSGVYNWANEIPGYLLEQINNGTWKGTNWLDAIRNENAPIQNHSINITGGNELSKFAMGFSYAGQEGILGKPVASDYDRYTGRINSDHVILKGNGFDVIKIGENLTFVQSSKHGIGTGNQYWNDVHNAIRTTPLLPIYNEAGGYYSQDDKTAEGWNLQGSIGNPIMDMALGSRGLNESTNYNLGATAYIEIQPIKNLKYRSVFSYNNWAWASHSYDGIRNVSTTNQVIQDNITQQAGSGHSITWQNTINYIFDINKEHNFDVLIGQELGKSGWGQDLEAQGKNSFFPGSFKNAYIDNAKPTDLSQVKIFGTPNGKASSVSFFGRANYNYKETYLLTAIIRADASSTFDRGHRWGYFPSVSAGWVLTNEAFMESAVESGFNFFKIRAGWGQNGNNQMPFFRYLANIVSNDQNAYFFGDDKGTPTTGAYPENLANPLVTWETNDQVDIGFDSRFLNQRLGVVFDWYRRTTIDWLVQPQGLGTDGTGPAWKNAGEVRNQGVELGLDWNDRMGDFSYGINLNGAYNKNKMVHYPNDKEILDGPANVLSQGTTQVFRIQSGYPMGYFYGYKTEGVFQNQAQIDEYKAAGKGVLSTVQPGDLIFADTNDDGAIDDSDKVMLGKGLPDWTTGLTITLGYKGFDFAATAYGNFGLQVLKSYRSFADSPLQNYTTDILGRWYGEGTSNKLPRLTSGSNSNWQNISDIYMEDADFVKISNVTLGYDFKKILPKLPLGQARLYFTVQGLCTFTKYSGMDPEIGYHYSDNDGSYNWATGIDLGFYPSARTYLVGVNLKF